MPLLKKFFYFSTAAIFVCAASPVNAAPEYCRILDVSGKAEIQPSGDVRWQPLSATRFLKGGDRIRTGDKGAVELSTGSNFSGLLKIGADTEVEIMGEDLARYFLRHGTLLVLREEDNARVLGRPGEEALFQIFTPDATAGFLQGGSSVSVSGKGTWVRVFAETVRVAPFRRGKEKNFLKTVSEGFKYFIGRPGRPESLGPSRMMYSDYMEWQAWMKKCYERKDARAEALLVRRPV